jgi:hypothetical protein
MEEQGRGMQTGSHTDTSSNNVKNVAEKLE